MSRLGLGIECSFLWNVLPSLLSIWQNPIPLWRVSLYVTSIIKPSRTLSADFSVPCPSAVSWSPGSSLPLNWHHWRLCRNESGSTYGYSRPVESSVESSYRPHLFFILLNSFGFSSLAELWILFLLDFSLLCSSLAFGLDVLEDLCGCYFCYILFPSSQDPFSHPSLIPFSSSWNIKPSHRPSFPPAWEGSSDKSLEIP